MIRTRHRQESLVWHLRKMFEARRIDCVLKTELGTIRPLTEDQWKAMNRVLLITSRATNSEIGGRAMLCNLNRSALTELFGEQLSVIEVAQHRIRGALGMAQAFRGYIDGVSRDVIDAIHDCIAGSPITHVFIDGSNFGEFAKAIKRRSPRVQVLTFFHNVEARFFLGSFLRTRSLRALAVMVANYLAERKSVRHSDILICLSARDSALLQKVYGRAATHVSPMALQDRFVGGTCVLEPEGERFALFVGGAFYANEAGIVWFADNVAPRVKMKTCVVGHGLEKLKTRLERAGNIEVVGSVASLAPWYQRAHVVVAPIFDGSGMKTKIAEALMFGKRLIGSPEAFSGYEEIAAVAGEICTTADEFAEAMNRSFLDPHSAADAELRAIYEKNYSYQAARERLQKVFESN